MIIIFAEHLRPIDGAVGASDIFCINWHDGDSADVRFAGRNYGRDLLLHLP